MKLKRPFLCAGLALALNACIPEAPLAVDLRPTLISVTVPQREGTLVVLQGRYFGDGALGQVRESYVLLGTDIEGEGGVRVRPESWRPSRIVLRVPEGVGYGYVFVVVDGVISNGLPANLP